MNILKILLVFLIANVLTLNAQQTNQINASREKTGRWIKYFDNGKIKYEGQFHNGKPYGVFTYYYNTGEIKAKNNFSEGGIIAYNTTLYKSGKIMSEGKYVNQKKDSIWNYYSDEPNLIISKEGYSHGVLNGKSITYYLNSDDTAEIVIYENGKKNGRLLKYFPDGTLMTESYYKDGMPDGDFTHYHINGSIQIIGKYYRGQQSGEWQYFDEEGNPIDEDEFRKQEDVEEIK